MNTLVIPSPVQDIAELRGRIDLWYDEDLLVSDLPPVVDQVANPSDMLGSHDNRDPFRSVAHGFWSTNKDGETVPYTRTEDNTAGQVPNALASTALAPLVNMVSKDARQFLDLPDDATVDIEYLLKRGLYTSHPQAAEAHIDDVASGISYLCAIGPSTIFLPGYFDQSQVDAAAKDSSNLSGITFASGDILRNNSTQLHRSPLLPEVEATPRALAILEIKNR
jgi:hypothetical protein